MAHHNWLSHPGLEGGARHGAVVPENLGGDYLICSIHHNLVVGRFPL